MKVVVLWENPAEQEIAQRVIKVIPNMLGSIVATICRDIDARVGGRRMSQPRVIARAAPAEQEMRSLDELFRPYQNDANELAAEAERLLAAQEAAFNPPPPDPVFPERKTFRTWGGDIVRSVMP